MLKRMAEFDVKQGLKLVLEQIQQASLKRPQELQCIEPILVAVSKTKPVDLIIEAYEAGQRHFGENYVKELEEKSTNPLILEKCKEIKWHFVGHLQTNKINKVLSAPNLFLVQTVHNQKLATNLNKNWPKFGAVPKLSVMIQVNTSDEDEKNGVDPKNACDLTKYVLNECPNLQLDGLMTIGKFGYNVEDGPNPDFLCLKRCRDEVCQQLGLDWKKLKLSMGMSADYAHAIELGSSYVRVGTAIFGYRAQKVPNT